jgi:Family of unknown function (DUF5681)
MSDGNSRNYKVGYGKPPIQSRFTKGRSGNGRRKRTSNVRNVLEKALGQLITVTEGGKTKKMTMFEIAIRQLPQNALEGRTPSISPIQVPSLKWRIMCGGFCRHSATLVSIPGTVLVRMSVYTTSGAQYASRLLWRGWGRANSRISKIAFRTTKCAEKKGPLTNKPTFVAVPSAPTFLNTRTGALLYFQRDRISFG